MPSTSKKQHGFMAAVANNPKFAKKVGIPQSVGKDFETADKGKTFNKGGMMKKDPSGKPGLSKLPTAVRNKMGYMKEGGKADMAQDKKIVKKAVGMHDKQMHGGKKTDMSMLKKGGTACAPKKMAAGGSTGSFRTSAGGINTKGKTKGTLVKMGGSTGMRKGGKVC